ncbi:MAG: response regulator [Candidatus Edwardsbacteria bacterium]
MLIYFNMSEKKILIVEDEKNLVAVIEFRLTKVGYIVLKAFDGEEGLKIAMAENPHLIISDIMMPKLNGLEFCGLLRANPKTKQIPFIFLTALDQVSDRVRGIKMGADDYIAKPIQMESLLKKIEEIFAKAEKEKIATEESIIAGDLSAMPIFDVLPLLEVNKKTGALTLTKGEESGNIYFENGALIEAEVESLVGEDAVYALLTWREGRFLFGPHITTKHHRIKSTVAEIIMEGVRLQDEKERLAEHLPALNDLLSPVPGKQIALEPRAEELEVAQIAHLIDGKRTVAQIITKSGLSQTKTLVALARLIAEGKLVRVPLEKILEKTLTKEQLFMMKGRIRRLATNVEEPLIGKIIVAGVHRTGKSTFVETLFSSLLNGQLVEGASTEVRLGTVDFGRLRISSDFLLHFYGVPGEKEFAFSWEMLLKKALAVLYLLDSTLLESIENSRLFLEFVKKEAVPCLVVANKSDYPNALSLEKIKTRLKVEEKIPVLPCNAIDPEGVRQVFAQLVEIICKTSVLA